MALMYNFRGVTAPLHLGLNQETGSSPRTWIPETLVRHEYPTRSLS